jgi:hypothetical protein
MKMTDKTQLILALNDSGLIEIEELTDKKIEVTLTSAGGDIIAGNNINESNYDIEIAQYHNGYEISGDIESILRTITDDVLEEMTKAMDTIKHFQYAPKNEDKFNISFDYEGKQALVVKDNKKDITYKIPVSLLDDGKIAEYNIVDRENELYELERLIGESHMMGSSISDYDRSLMKEDLETLKSTDEEYVLGYYGTNGFLTKKSNLEEFNEACQELIDSYTEHISTFSFEKPALVNVTGYYKDSPDEDFEYLAAIGDIGDAAEDEDLFYYFSLGESIIGDHGDFVIKSYEIETEIECEHQNSFSKIAELTADKAETQEMK